eukprot:TRINITY_DN5763_c0_g1_i9.p1 TRINITY_DN5763_c0_g1~~TRINITY_DN5763_c0_g1_i9.p1  ORF type:complete len:475 (-),score=39.80 TRINITY_DN5763_c0_g1_i9:45-1469(-)
MYFFEVDEQIKPEATNFQMDSIDIKDESSLGLREESRDENDPGIEEFWSGDLWTLYIYKCDICDKRLVGEKDLWNHRQMTHHSSLMTTFVTVVCKYLLKESKVFMSHQCNICGERLLGNDRLWIHRKKHHADLAVPCTQCDYVGLDENSLKSHISEEHAIHRQEKPETTKEPDENIDATHGDLEQNIKLKRIRLENGAKKTKKKKIKKETKQPTSHTCPQCDYTTGTLIKYNEHMRLQHQQTIEYTCNLCHFKSKWKQVIKNHKKVEHEGQRFQCDSCSFQAKSSVALKTHKNIKHGVGESFPCEQCGHIAPNRGRLNFHMKTMHEGASFSCPECDFTTSRKGSLKNHMVSQHGDQEYLCDMCDYRTSKKGNLTAHIDAKHKGIKYPCKLCSFQATYTNDLRKHMRTVHEGVKYQCEQCDFTSTRKFAVTRHTKKVHLGVRIPSIEKSVHEDDIKAETGKVNIAHRKNFSSLQS